MVANRSFNPKGDVLALALAAAFACAAPAAEAAFPGKPGRIAVHDPARQPRRVRRPVHGRPQPPRRGPQAADAEHGRLGNPGFRLLPLVVAERGTAHVQDDRGPVHPHGQPAESVHGAVVGRSGRREPSRRVARDEHRMRALRPERLAVRECLARQLGPHPLLLRDPETGDSREPAMNSEALAQFDTIAPSNRAYVSNQGGSLFLNVTGKKKRRLTNDQEAGLAFDPTFSPDGSAIAWIRSASTATEDGFVEVYDLRTGAIRQLTPVMDVGDISWRPMPVVCGSGNATQVGTKGRDIMVGGPGRDVLVGLGGRDTIRGGKGNDVICGGKGQGPPRRRPGQGPVHRRPGRRADAVGPGPTSSSTPRWRRTRSCAVRAPAARSRRRSGRSRRPRPR